jgi:hypothetical protein
MEISTQEWRRLMDKVAAIPVPGPASSLRLDATDIRALLWADVLFRDGNVLYRVSPREARCTIEKGEA